MKTINKQFSPRALRAVTKEIYKNEYMSAEVTDGDFARIAKNLCQSSAVSPANDSVIYAACALFYKAAERTLGIRLFDTQLLAACLLKKGFCVDMKPGEGKTLSVALAAYLRFIEGKTVYIVTANDYLSKRDFLYTQKLFSLLGVKTRLLDESFLKKNVSAPEKEIIFASCTALPRIQDADASSTCAVLDDIDVVLPVLIDSDCAFLKAHGAFCGTGGAARYIKDALKAKYDMPVIPLFQNKRTVRKDARDSVFKTTAEQINAVCLEVGVSCTRWGQPVLIGVETTQKALSIKKALAALKINADIAFGTDAEHDASIMENAGKLGAVTIAVQDAGLGVPITLGGTEHAKENIVKSVGGLYVIGTKHAKHAKDDFLLRAKSGTQGAPGVTRFFVSKEESK